MTLQTCPDSSLHHREAPYAPQPVQAAPSEEEAFLGQERNKLGHNGQPHLEVLCDTAQGLLHRTQVLGTAHGERDQVQPVP